MSDQQPGKNTGEKRRQHLGKTLFVILSTLAESRKVTEPMLQEHLAYQYRLEDEGITFAAGPLFGPHDEAPAGGLIIVRAASFDEARRIAEADPFHRDGVRTFEIRRWILNEGGITVKLSYSDRTMTVQ